MPAALVQVTENAGPRHGLTPACIVCVCGCVCAHTRFPASSLSFPPPLLMHIPWFYSLYSPWVISLIFLKHPALPPPLCNIIQYVLFLVRISSFPFHLPRISIQLCEKVCVCVRENIALNLLYNNLSWLLYCYSHK